MAFNRGQRTRQQHEPNFPYDRLGFGGSNIETEQPDQEQFDALRKAMVNGMVPFDCVIELLQTKNSPPQVRQNVYHADLTVAASPVLLIPTNTKRMGFVVTNLSIRTIWFSYDWPISIEVDGVRTLVGIPIPAASVFLESNGLASINDIYVWTNTLDDGSDKVGVGGFEAVVTISPENMQAGVP